MTWTCPKCQKVLRKPGGHPLSCGTGSSERRFWEKVEKTDSCWLYRGFIKWDGYGWLCRNGRYMTAHRYSWILAHGHPPEGAHILHTCDVPACCNPAHLRLGTHEDNMADMKAKRRQAFGERAGSARLTIEEVRAIRAEYWCRGKESNIDELAAKYPHSSKGAIYQAARGKSWKIDQKAKILHPARVRPARQA